MKPEYPNKNDGKVLVIGIDGGTFNILSPMVKKGLMPNIECLLKTGCYGNLQSTIPPVTAPAWSSFITGTNPGQHGVFYFFKNDNDQRSQNVLVNLQDITGIPFWRVLNAYGKKVGLINIPLTYPPENVDKFMISGMFVPEGANDFTFPPNLYEKLDSYSVDLDGLMIKGKWKGKNLVKKNRNLFIENVHNITKSRSSNALMLMKNEIWDFFMIVFTGSDRICHFFWKDADDKNNPSKIIQDYFKMLDCAIGDLIDAAGKNTTKIVMSDHGFGPSPENIINLGSLMLKLGYTKFVPNAMFNYLKSIIKRKLFRTAPPVLNKFIDWTKSEIFMQPIYANYLGIYFQNSKDLTPKGKSKNSNILKIKEDVFVKLERLVNPNNNKPLVKKIYHREELYIGPHLTDAPDIIVEFSSNYKFGYFPFRNKLIIKHKDPIRTGEHRREGVFIASGPQIASGNIKSEMHIDDVTSSLLYSMGVPIPKSYDGKIVKEIFRESFLKKNKPIFCDSKFYNVKNESNNTSDDRQNYAKSKKLLEDLGYM
jgi:predicted AlkP superfamily phosphohydrolase/phosphomutase